MQPSAVAVVLLAGAFALGRISPYTDAGTAHEAAPIVDTVRAETIREVTTALTAPEMEGRGTGQPGGDRAAEYLARRFASAGAEPLGTSGFLQTVSLARRTIDTASLVHLDNEPLRFVDDYLLMPPLLRRYPDVAGGVIFVGWGVKHVRLGRDELAGVPLRGRVAFLLNAGRPENVDSALWGQAADRDVVLRQLAAQGVVAAITIAGFGSFEGARQFLGRPAITLDQPSSEAPPIPVFMVSERVAERLFAGSGTSFSGARAAALRGPASRALATRFSASLRVAGQPMTGQNVIAVIPGSAPSSRQEAVVYSAHYDAFGRDPSGAVRAGAADNALGVAKLVALAEAFAQAHPRPRRSVVFLASTAEEYGNLGTEYWLDHPTWPLDLIAVNINFDGIGTDVWGRVRQVTDYGISYSDAVDGVRSVLTARGMVLAPDRAPEQVFFQRSDHFSFTKRGIPPVYLIGSPGTPATGERAERFLAAVYHTPGDTIEADWNWEGARDLAMVGYLVGHQLAQQPTMPTWLPASPYNRPRGARVFTDRP